MDFEHAAIALLASVVLVLAGMVGWLYWQQTKMFQNMNNIVMAVGEIASRPSYPEPLPEPEHAPEEEQEVEIPQAEVEDDRASVDEDVDIVDGPPSEGLDTDGLEGKTSKDLRDILTKRGIPFGKRDSKNILISLLKATA
jgi:hypothetical protein